MESLTKKVLDFQGAGKGAGDLVREIAPAVYGFPHKRMGLDEDACGEFYERFQPRLVRMLGRYREQGRSFDAYLHTCLGWQLCNFARARRAGERRWEADLRMAAGGDQAVASPPADLDGGTDQEALPAAGIPPALSALLRTPADRRNFLFFALKCPGLSSDSKGEAAAAAAGVTLSRLRELELLLAERGAARRARLRELAARRNGAFCAARLLETELRCETDPDRRQALQARLQKATRRMRTAMERMARVGLAPTNREIAEVLGIPKGTVDSGLYFLKRKLAAAVEAGTRKGA